MAFELPPRGNHAPRLCGAEAYCGVLRCAPPDLVRVGPLCPHCDECLAAERRAYVLFPDVPPAPSTVRQWWPE